MPFESLPTYTVTDLERGAHDYLHRQFGPDIPIPVDVDWLLEAVERVDLDDWPKLRTNHGIEGGVWRDTDTGELVVYIAEELMDDESPKGYSRYRMTVAEELAHLHLHRPVVNQITGLDQFCELQRHALWQQMERNAKRYAAALLMPGAQLSAYAERVYSRLVARAGTDNPAAIKKWLCTLLSKEFVVSETSMQHRLGEWPMRIYTRVEQAARDGLGYLP